MFSRLFWLGREAPVIKVLLAGKHELACRAFNLLKTHEDIDLRVVLCHSEKRDGSREALGDFATSDDLLAESDSPLRAAVEQFRPRLLISAGYDRIVKGDVLALLPRAINIHFGRLPRYRGCWSIPWAILNDDDEIGVTLHEIDSSIDGGPIISQTVFPNNRNADCRDLYLCAVSAGEMLLEGFLAGQGGTVKRQDERLATYYPSIYPGKFQISWNNTTKYIANYVRAAHFPPYAGAFSCVDTTRISFEWPITFQSLPTLVPCGTVIRHEGCYCVGTEDGIVRPNTILVDGMRMEFSQAVIEFSLEGRQLD